MVIQAGAGRLDAPDGAARFAGIREAGTEALAELDRLVELLRTDGAGRPRDLERLSSQARATGLRLEYTPLPADVHVTPEVEDAAYRVVQEGLTNAMKHAAGSDVAVRVGAGAAELEVEVSDRGAVAPSPLAASGAGLGLAGMRERVAALGGAVDAGPRDGARLARARPRPAGVAGVRSRGDDARFALQGDDAAAGARVDCRAWNSSPQSSSPARSATSSAPARRLLVYLGLWAVIFPIQTVVVHAENPDDIGATYFVINAVILACGIGLNTLRSATARAARAHRHGVRGALLRAVVPPPRARGPCTGRTRPASRRPPRRSGPRARRVLRLPA